MKNNFQKTFCLLFLALVVSSCGDDPDPVEEIQFTEAFPDLSFSVIVDIQSAGDERLFIAEQQGRILVLSNTTPEAEQQVFLNIVSKTLSDDRFGLMGFTFHPNYASNGLFYVHYTTAGPNRSVVSQFQVNAGDPDLANVGSEVVLIEVNQPHRFHNGGQLAFGPDGYLYISFGDGGPHDGSPDPDNRGQDRTSLLGSILRIDVNTTSLPLNYGIPTDNPFVGNDNGFREEIYAYGFRNTWKFSFDSQTGKIWGAENGENTWEEINHIEAGNNYGWKIMEGNECFSPGCNPATFELPFFQYGDDGSGSRRSVIGGFVYRGNDVPDMTGKYLYGDFLIGNIWSLDDNSSNPNNQLVESGMGGITTFGLDQRGELYVARVESGGSKIYKLVLM